MSIVRDNLMTRKDYKPYCGNENCRFNMPRTRYIGGQFQCGCGWRSSFEADFIEAYEAKWTEPAAPKDNLRVEPLKWSQDRKATVLGATWMVWPYPDPLNDGLGNWLWQVVDAYPHASGRFHSEAEAKAAAEEDYEARILSFIATTEGSDRG